MSGKLDRLLAECEGQDDSANFDSDAVWRAFRRLRGSTNIVRYLKRIVPRCTLEVADRMLERTFQQGAWNPEELLPQLIACVWTHVLGVAQNHDAVVPFATLWLHDCTGDAQPVRSFKPEWKEYLQLSIREWKSGHGLQTRPPHLEQVVEALKKTAIIVRRLGREMQATLSDDHCNPQMPLVHYLIRNHLPPLIIYMAICTYPEQIRQRDAWGNLPLFYANLSGSSTSFWWKIGAWDNLDTSHLHKLSRPVSQLRFAELFEEEELAVVAQQANQLLDHPSATRQRLPLHRDIYRDARYIHKTKLNEESNESQGRQKSSNDKQENDAQPCPQDTSNSLSKEPSSAHGPENTNDQEATLDAASELKDSKVAETSTGVACSGSEKECHEGVSPAASGEDLRAKMRPCTPVNAEKQASATESAKKIGSDVSLEDPPTKTLVHLLMHETCIPLLLILYPQAARRKCRAGRFPLHSYLLSLLDYRRKEAFKTFWNTDDYSKEILETHHIVEDWNLLVEAYPPAMLEEDPHIQFLPVAFPGLARHSRICTITEHEEEANLAAAKVDPSREGTVQAGARIDEMAARLTLQLPDHCRKCSDAARIGDNPPKKIPDPVLDHVTISLTYSMLRKQPKVLAPSAENPLKLMRQYERELYKRWKKQQAEIVELEKEANRLEEQLNELTAAQGGEEESIKKEAEDIGDQGRAAHSPGASLTGDEFSKRKGRKLPKKRKRATDHSMETNALERNAKSPGTSSSSVLEQLTEKAEPPVTPMTLGRGPAKMRKKKSFTYTVVEV